MSNLDFIKEIAKFGLENDQEKLLLALNELIEHSKKTRKINFALQLQSILKEAINQQKSSGLVKVDSPKYLVREEDKEISEFILEKLTSEYRFDNLILSDRIKDELKCFIEEHQKIDLIRKYDLPVSNKVLFYGPSGCGKTLAAYVLAGELDKLMYVVNLGAIVSSKLGETSKNLAKIFKKATTEKCIIFIDEFDSLGKVRDYNQDHGEMKRVVNTILQLFDYLPQDSIVIAATNQKEMLDSALTRRFDLNLKFDLPNETQLKLLVKKIMESGRFKFDKPIKANAVIKKSIGLSYYTVQKTLITAIKRSLFSKSSNVLSIEPTINLALWESLIIEEKNAIKTRRKKF